MVGRQSRPGGGAGLAAPDAAEPGGGSTRPSSVVVRWSAGRIGLLGCLLLGALLQVGLVVVVPLLRVVACLLGGVPRPLADLAGLQLLVEVADGGLGEVRV